MDSLDPFCHHRSASFETRFSQRKHARRTSSAAPKWKRGLAARPSRRPSFEWRSKKHWSRRQRTGGKMTSVGKMLRFNSWSEACCICCEEMPRDAAATLGCSLFARACDRAPVTGGRSAERSVQIGVAMDQNAGGLLPKPTIFRLHASNIHRKAMASGAKPRPCPTADCGMQKIFEDARSARDTCPLCEKESCWWCGAQPFHENMTCEQWRDVRRRFLKWMKETGTKQCPTCGMATSKENLEMQSDQVEECHKMLCRSCGTKFCFACLAILTDSYTCGCTQNAHNFVDPHTGKLVKHLKKPKAKAKRR
eukprot:g10126.t1